MDHSMQLCHIKNNGGNLFVKRKHRKFVEGSRIGSFLDRIIGNKELFLGIRDESVIIYYWGKNMMELASAGDQKGIVKISKFFIDRTAFAA